MICSRLVQITAPRQVCLCLAPVSKPQPKEILIRARLSLLSSGTEKTCYRGDFETPSHWSRWVRYPFSPGYCIVGEIEVVGTAVSRWQVGDRVVVRRPHQSHVIVSEESPYLVPADIPDESAVWFALSAIAQHAVREAGPVLGEAAAVVGLGPLGQLVAQYAQVAGAAQVLAVSSVECQLAAAQEHGAIGVAHRAEDAAGQVLELTEGAGVELAYDATGAPSALAAVARFTRPSGSVVLVGDTPWPSNQFLGGDVLRQGLRVIGIHDSRIVRAPRGDGHRWTYADNVQLFFQLVRQGRIRVEDLITHRYAPESAAEAYAALDRSDERTLGIVFDWRGEET